MRCWSATSTATGNLRYAGRVGTGFDAKERSRLERLLASQARERSPFEGKRGPRGARYVEPRLVAEVEFTEWTNDGMLRHPSYKGLVEMDPEDVVLEDPSHDYTTPEEARKTAVRRAPPSGR